MKLVMTLGLMNWLSDGLDKVMGAILQGIRTLFFSIDSMLYDLIIRAYDMFRLLCTGRLLNQTLLNSISERIGIILGVVMFFNVCFAFIKMLLEPDKLNDKDAGAGAIIKKSILVIVMLGMSSFVFNTLYKVQKSIVESNVISKLILPYTIEANDGEDGLDKFGNILSMELLSSFYALDSNLNPSTGEASSQLDLCKNYYYALRNQIYHTGKFDLGYNCLNTTITADISNGISSEQQEVFVIDFNWLFSAVAGGIVLYLMIMYCFKVGVRMIQLAVLEVISPMAFVSYLSPKKDTMLSKWSKIYVSTYIDVFIRIAIINFVVFLIAAIFDAQGLSGIEFWNSMGLNPDTTNFATKAFLNVVIILALLSFAHKAPDLIKELLPASASKLGFGASMKDIVGLQKGIGMVAGAATGAAVGFLGGAIAGTGLRGKITGAFGGLGGGIFRGAHAGFGAKGVGAAIGTARKNQSDYTKKMADIRTNGGSWFGSKMSGFEQALTGRSGYDILEEEYKDAEDYVSTYDSLKKKADSEVNKFEDNYKFTDSTGRTMTLSELNKARNDDVHYTETERAAYETIYNKIHGFARDQAMSNNGAIKNGEMVWTDSGTGDWRDIETSRRDRFTASDISFNAEISAKMQKMLKSEHAGTHGTNFDKVKAANDYYDGKVQSKINDDKYKRAKANAGK